MRSHIAVELLSAYLDRELDPRPRRRVEAHLTGCSECRRQLASLERVTMELHALERLSAPPQIGLELSRVTSLARVESGFLEKLEAQISRWTYSGSLLPLFAVVLALVVVMYLFSLGLARHQSGLLPVELQPAEKHAETAESSPAAGRIVEVGTRQLILVGDIWIERGLEEAAEVEVVGAAHPAARSLLEAEPELGELLDRGQSIRLREDGKILEIEPSNR